MKNKQNSQRGFTLIELLVVIVIIGILATISVATFSGYFDKARAAHAQAELAQINKDLIRLTLDTGLLPGAQDANICVHNNEVNLEDCEAGLYCTDGSFPNWRGPYSRVDYLDPWGNRYIFDPDTHCTFGANNPNGCEPYDGEIVRSILSPGPDGEYGSTSQPTLTYDNIVLVLCHS